MAGPAIPTAPQGPSSPSASSPLGSWCWRGCSQSGGEGSSLLGTAGARAAGPRLRWEWGCSTPTLPWGLTSPHTQSPLLYTATLFRTPPWPPNTWQATGWGDGWQGRPRWHWSWQGAVSASWGPPGSRTPPPTYGFGEEPGEEQRREGQERTQREGRGALRLSLRLRFFILFSPFLM